MLFNELHQQYANTPLFHYRDMSVLCDKFFQIGRKALDKGVFRPPYPECIIQLDGASRGDDVSLVYFAKGDRVAVIFVNQNENPPTGIPLATLIITAEGTRAEPTQHAITALGREAAEAECRIASDSYIAAWGGLHCDAYRQTKHSVSDSIKRHRANNGLPPLVEPVIMRLRPDVDLTKVGGTKLHLPRAEVRGHDRRGHLRKYKSGAWGTVKPSKVKGGALVSRHYEVK